MKKFLIIIFSTIAIVAILVIICILLNTRENTNTDMLLNINLNAGMNTDTNIELNMNNNSTNGINTQEISGNEILTNESPIQIIPHEPIKTQDNKKTTEIKVTIAKQTYKAKLYNNKTAEELMKKFPLNLTMNDLNDNEKYYYFDSTFTTNEEQLVSIKAGDIMLYGNDCLVVFYESFETPYKYTKVGYIENLPDDFNEIIGNGSVTINFSKK